MAKKKERDAGRSAADRVVAAADAADLALVRFLYVDHAGVVRGKAVSRARLAERMAAGIGLTVAMQAMSLLDELQPVDGMGPAGEIRLVPDPATFAVLPYAPGAGAMAADLVRLDGQPWEACPRSFLKQAVATLAAEGIALVAAFEPEFTLGHLEPDPDGGEDRLVPVDESLCFSTTGFGQAHDYAVELVRALEAQGLEVEQYYPELGHGQQELSIRHAPALRAADNQVAYRETVRGVAWRQGLWASLAPKPLPDQAGNGAHLHLSLWEAKPDGQPGGRNLLYDPDDRYGLSSLGYHFVAGVRAHLRQRQQLPAPGAALLVERVHLLRPGQPRGRGAHPVAPVGRRRGLLQPRAQAVRRDRQPLPRPRRRDPRRPRRHPQQARPRQAGRGRPGLDVEQHPAPPRHPAAARLPVGGTGRAGTRRAADGGPRPAAPHRLPGGQALRGGHLRRPRRGLRVPRAPDEVLAVPSPTTELTRR